MRGFPALAGAVLLIACSDGDALDAAPENPGVTDVGATSFDGEPFVPADGDLVFVEDSTGTRFNLMGQAFEGPMAADKVQLGQLPAMTAFWFAWSTHHPGARVWQNGINNDGIEIEPDGECGVPCGEIITGCFGGMDCIPSVDDPVWTDTDDTSAIAYLDDADRVLGLTHEGGARAYPLDALWTHEIVNDTWNGWKFSATYCPLTGSGIVLDGSQGGVQMRFGVSGNLYNSNLVVYDRKTESLYGQMRQVGFVGENLGLPLTTVGLVDTTWGAWRQMFPGTEVLSGVHASGYPYGDYREDHDDTFIVNNPLPDPKYPNKSYAIGVIAGGETAIYAFEEIEARQGELSVVQDSVGGVPVLVAYDGRSETAVVFSRTIDGEERQFSVE